MADSFSSFGPFRGLLHPSFRSETLEEALGSLPELLADPKARILQAGRNLTVRITLARKSGDDLDVVVKRFARQSLWKNRVAARRGSKALRAYRAAAHLHDQGIATPDPVAVLERWEGGRLHESYLLTRYRPGLSSFRENLIALYRRHGPCEELMAMLERVAVSVARMHDAGFLHRDLGNQNLLFAPPTSRTGEPEVLVIDLNRGACRPAPLSDRERARDLSRIHLPSDFLRVFKEMYWRGAVPSKSFQQWERRYRRWYGWHAATRSLRHPLRPEPPPPPEGDYPDERDLWIWDERSVQAIPAFRSRDRNRLRLPGRVPQTVAAVFRNAWPVWAHYRTLRDQAFQSPVHGIGERATVAVTARPETLDRELELLRELGGRNVLLRLYHHEPHDLQRFTMEALRRLHEQGYGVSLALVQDRSAVRNPQRWSEFGRTALREVGHLVRWVEVGHAVNRVKWGLWGLAELTSLHSALSGWSREFPNVRFTGPAGIDFEPEFLLTALQSLPREARYAALSHHLYLDRRGAPEERQGPFDAVGKLALIRAVARHSGRFGDALIVSEFNWPLQGTGVWSPVGSPYESPGERHNDPSVDERQAACYALRYLLLGIGSGLAGEMVFWRLAARGFGLVDDSDPKHWRKRPAFEVLRTWHDQLNGSTVESCTVRQGWYALSFRREDGEQRRVVWRGPHAPVECPLDAFGSPPCSATALDAFGNPVDPECLPGLLEEGVPAYWNPASPA